MKTNDEIFAAAQRLLSADEASEYMRLSRPAARIGHATRKAGHSRFGGTPLMTAEWPTWDDKPLAFLGLLDLADFTGVETGLDLPPSGFLNFFYEAEEQQAWGYDPAHVDGWRAIYAEPGAAHEVVPPPGTQSFDPVWLEVKQSVSVPDPGESVLDQLRGRSADELHVLHEELQEEGWPSGTLHQVGGWPGIAQNPIWLECQLAANGIYVGDSEGYADPRVADLEAGAVEWQLLFQVDTDDAAGWMWGDVGMLYFAIRQSDLERRRFDRTWMILQC